MPKLYKLLRHHEKVFGDDKARPAEEIYQKVFGDPLTDAIESWAKRIPASTRSFYIVELPTSILNNYCDQPGWEKRYARGKHEQLIKDIKKEGIKIPLVIVLSKEKKYNVIEGGHRAAVAKMLGLRTVPAFILEEQ